MLTKRRRGSLRMKSASARGKERVEEGMGRKGDMPVERSLCSGC